MARWPIEGCSKSIAHGPRYVNLYQADGGTWRKDNDQVACLDAHTFKNEVS